MKTPCRSLAPFLTALLWHASLAASGYYEIHVVDEATGRGVPLAELTTVNQVHHVTDSAGRVALNEPGLAGETVFFTVSAHGYAPVAKDGFGISGARLEVQPGGRGVIKLQRLNLAERLYRSTGQGIYRDSVLLGHQAPLADPWGAGKVAGQDSVSAIPYRDKIYWFWGDTGRMSYPLGLFRMAGATTLPPGKGGLAPSVGVDYQYFTGKDGFCRAMAEVANPEGVVWVFGFGTVRDESGTERMVGHFSRRKGLTDELEHGMMIWNEEREIFEVKSTLPLEERWRFLDGQLLPGKVAGEDYLYNCTPFPTVRVRANLAHVMDPAKYEAWTCLPPQGDPETADPVLTAKGMPDWQWRRDAPPTGPAQESRWLKSGKISPSQLRYLPVNAEDPSHRVRMHGGTVRWNAHRQKWICLAVEFAYEVKDSPSPLGEMWYSEADAPEGPFEKTVRVVSHRKQTFYNPVHHSFMDEDGGRTIYFEGTYTNQFVEAAPTPRYDYNQIMYRLDLDHPKLKAAFAR
jgi:hypothetical protein